MSQELKETLTFGTFLTQDGIWGIAYEIIFKYT